MSYECFLNHCSAGGTQAVLSGLIRNFDVLPQTLLDAFPPIPLPSTMRHSCVIALQKAIKVRRSQSAG